MLSTKPDKAVGDNDRWNLATDSLRRTLENRGQSYEIDKGGGAFYGPKIDIHIRDALGRLWQCTTVQFDFNLPDRFRLTYIADDGKEYQPYMIHRALLGSLERFMGVLIEHYGGAFPVWLAPVQAKVIPIADRHLDYASQVELLLSDAGLRVQTDQRDERMNAKIRDAQLEKVPFMLVVGDTLEREVVDSVKDIILDEINVENIEYIEDSNELVSRTAKANFKRLGARLGKSMKTAAAKISQFDETQITQLLTNGSIEIDMDGEVTRLDANDVEILSEELGGWSVTQEGRITVALDTEVTQELLLRGFAREVVNRTQTMRKTADLELTDRIHVEYCASGDLREAIATQSAFICQETLASELKYCEQPEGTFVDSFEIGDRRLTIALSVAFID